MKITLNELRKIVRSVLKEEADIAQEPQMKAAKAAEAIKKALSPNEIEYLKSMYKNLGEKGLKREVVNILSLEDSINEYGHPDDDLDTYGELTEKQLKLRKIIHKIKNIGTVLAALGVVPAAMISGGIAAVAFGIAAVAGFLLKDLAFWNFKGGIHRDAHDEYADEPLFGDDDRFTGNGL